MQIRCIHIRMFKQDIILRVTIQKHLRIYAQNWLEKWRIFTRYYMYEIMKKSLANLAIKINWLFDFVLLS